MARALPKGGKCTQEEKKRGEERKDGGRLEQWKSSCARTISWPWWSGRSSEPLLHRCPRLYTVERILYRVSVVGNQPLAIDFFASQANVCSSLHSHRRRRLRSAGALVCTTSRCGSLDGIREKVRGSRNQAVLPRLVEEPIRFWKLEAWPLVCALRCSATG